MNSVIRISSFPPLIGDDPRILILGSMPGVASLAQQQYYAQPRNAFWPIMGELFAAGPQFDYAERTRRLVRAGVAVWDVLESCVRRGSLDSSIEAGSEVPNDLAGLLLRFPQIRHIFFNGRKAEQLFSARVMLQLAARGVDGRSYVSLPSTSPAMATLDFAGKLQRWQVVRAVLDEISAVSRAESGLR